MLLIWPSCMMIALGKTVEIKNAGDYIASIGWYHENVLNKVVFKNGKK